MTKLFPMNVDTFINNTTRNVEDVWNKSIIGNNHGQYYSCDRSFNYQTVANKDTRLVIVGTYTPYEGRQKGYYYTSSRNKQYEILDQYFGSDLVSMKKQLKKTGGNNNIVGQIKQELIKYNIAFSDVIDEAVSPNKYADDDFINPFCLDRKRFINFFEINNHAIYIANSENAKYAFEKMFPDGPKIEYAPQTCRGDIKKKLLPKWRNILDKYYDRNNKKWR